MAACADPPTLMIFSELLPSLYSPRQPMHKAVQSWREASGIHQCRSSDCAECRELHA